MPCQFCKSYDHTLSRCDSEMATTMYNDVIVTYREMPYKIMKFIKFVCVIIFQNKHGFGKYLKLLSLISFFHKYPEIKHHSFINIRKINACLGVRTFTRV